jgi:hypothetical protein
MNDDIFGSSYNPKEALPELLAELWTDFTNSEEEAWCLLKSEIESIFEQGSSIYIRTKSSDVIQTNFTSIVEAKQICL